MEARVHSSIRRIILAMDKPFLLSDLFSAVRNEYKIIDSELILEELDALIDCGLVTNSEFIDDLAIYQSTFATA